MLKYELSVTILQGICGNPWPILNSALKGLSQYEIPKEKCSEAGLFSDPDNCSGYVSCIRGVHFIRVFLFYEKNCICQKLIFRVPVPW